MERERGEELVTFIQDAARKRRLGQAVSRMMDVPSVPPGDLAHAQLRQLLCADVTTAERATMLRWRAERGMDQPETAMRRLREDLRDEARVKELVQKWRPRLAAARYKKRPAGTGLRTEHFKPFFEALEGGVVVLFEAIERFAIPDSIAMRLDAAAQATRRLNDVDTRRHTGAHRHGRGPLQGGVARARELGGENHRPRAPLLRSDGRRPKQAHKTHSQLAATHPELAYT